MARASGRTPGRWGTRPSGPLRAADPEGDRTPVRTIVMSQDIALRMAAPRPYRRPGARRGRFSRSCRTQGCGPQSGEPTAVVRLPTAGGSRPGRRLRGCVDPRRALPGSGTPSYPVRPVPDARPGSSEHRDHHRRPLAALTRSSERPRPQLDRRPRWTHRPRPPAGGDGGPLRTELRRS